MLEEMRKVVLSLLLAVTLPVCGVGSQNGTTSNPRTDPWYLVGGDVTAPVPLYRPEPEYSEEARKARYQGSVMLYVEVDANGDPHNLKVVRSLGLGRKGSREAVGLRADSPQRQAGGSRNSDRRQFHAEPLKATWYGASTCASIELARAI
jgi:hypothetical protein